MKRVGIIIFNNLRYAPYVKFYTDTFSGQKDIEYEIIYYNRDRKLNEPVDEHHIPIPWFGKGTNSASKIEKSINFAIWRKHICTLLKKKKYDFIIVLTTTAGVLLEKYLSNAYDGKYIFDIRDYTKEHIKQFYNAEKKVIQHSKLNIISSPAFKKFLPEGDYRICHNLSIANEAGIKYTKNISLPIQISYIGSISYEEQCIKLIRLVNEDERFSFVFYGNENTSHKVSKEIKSLNNARIKMMGPFFPDEKKQIYSKSSLVFNCYGNKTPLVLHAISNKHYDGALYRTPILNSPGTIMDELAGEYGYALDLDNISNLDTLYNWYVNLDENLYNKYAEKVINSAKEDNKMTSKAVISSIVD